MFYTLGKRLEILEYINSDHTDVHSARNFGIVRITSWSWKDIEWAKTKNHIKVKGKHAKRPLGRPLLQHITEDKLVLWTLESRDLQLPTQRKTMQWKALIQSTNSEFRVCDGWLQKFMIQNSLSFRRHTSIQQRLRSNLEKSGKNLSAAFRPEEMSLFFQQFWFSMWMKLQFFDIQGARTGHKVLKRFEL
jgi:hypothetical protein